MDEHVYGNFGTLLLTDCIGAFYRCLNFFCQLYQVANGSITNEETNELHTFFWWGQSTYKLFLILSLSSKAKVLNWSSSKIIIIPLAWRTFQALLWTPILKSAPSFSIVQASSEYDGRCLAVSVVQGKRNGRQGFCEVKMPWVRLSCQLLLYKNVSPSLVLGHSIDGIKITLAALEMNKLA